MKKYERLVSYLKAFGTGFLFIWLYLKSPLNSLYEDFTKPEMNFVYVSFISWILLSAFLIWAVFFVNRDNFHKNLSKMLIFATSVYLIFLIPYGFDTTDTGFHLSKQWFMFHGMWKENMDVIAGTNLIGGLWLLIPGEPMLIWARFGFVLVHAAITYFSYKILILYFEPVKSFFMILALTIFISPWNFYFTINYDNLPLMFMLVSVYFLLRSFKTTDTSHSKYLVLSSGAISIIAVFCKLTVFPLVFLLIYLTLTENSLNRPVKNSGAVKNLMTGFVSASAVIFLIIAFTGALPVYFDFFRNSYIDFITEKAFLEKASALQDHSFAALYGKYTSVILMIISNIYVTLFLLILSAYVISKIKKYHVLLRVTVFMVVFWILYYRLFGDSNISERMLVEIFIISTLSFVLCLYAIWLFSSEKVYIKEQVVPMIAISSVFILSFIGSDLGFSTAFRSGAGVVLLAYAVLLASGTEITFNKHIIKFGFVYNFIIIAFFIGFINSEFTFYRDLGYSEVQTDFRTPSLSGIKTNKARSIVVDELFDFLNQIEKISKKKVLFTHNNAMMYYLANVKYPMITPWDVINDLDMMKADFRKKLPDYIVLAKTTHQEATWPYTNSSMDSKKYQKYYDFYIELLGTESYVEAYKNYYYTVYELKKDDNEL